MKKLRKNKIKDIFEVDKTKSEFMIINIKQKNTTEASKLFCDKIEYLHLKDGKFFDHHLMFYLRKNLIFKIWLPNEPQDKEFMGAKEALESVGIKVYDPSKNKWLTNK